MRQILVIAPNPDIQDDPPFRIRILPLVELLKPYGFELHVKIRPRNYFARLAQARSAAGYHAVIMKSKMIDPSEARILRRNARRILFDIDDAHMYHHRKLDPYSQWRLDRRFKATTKIIDEAVVGNEYLADIFQKHGCRCTIVPTVVDPAHYPVKQHADTPTLRLVWIGTESTLGYVQTALPAIHAAVREVPGLRLVIVCSRTIEQAQVPVDFLKWSLPTEGPSLVEGDIGIAPTPLDRFTLGKCGFKVVQYMAAGLPVIASPVGANSTLVREGENGLLPQTLEDWPAAIVQLARDSSLRARMGHAGRKRVEEELSIQRMAQVWAKLLDS